MQINDTDLHKPIKDYFRAQCNEWLAKKVGLWMTLPQEEIDSSAKAALSATVLRNRAADWLDAAVDRVLSRDADGSNVVSRAWKRIYFDPARDPALVARAKAWRDAKLAAAAALATAEAEKARLEAVAAAIAASTAAGLGSSDAAVAVLAAQQAAAPVQPPKDVELGPPPDLLDYFAEREASFHIGDVPKPTKPRHNKSGKVREMSTRRRTSNAARAAAAHRSVSGKSDDEDDNGSESDVGAGGGGERAPPAAADAAAVGSKRPPRSRPAGRGGGAASAKVGKAGRSAAPAPASALAPVGKGDDDRNSSSDSTDSDGDDSSGPAGDSSSSTDVSVARVRTQSGRAISAPLGKGRSMAAAATAAAEFDSDGDPGSRSRAAKEIPWLWVRVQEHVTAGRLQAAEKAWIKVKEKVKLVLAEYEEEQAHIHYWTSKLAKMAAAFGNGGSAVLGYRLK